MDDDWFERTQNSMNPKFGRTSPSRRKCWEENMSTLDKNQIWFTQFLTHEMNPINDICTVASTIYHISSWNTESSSCEFLKISRVLGTRSLMEGFSQKYWYLRLVSQQHFQSFNTLNVQLSCAFWKIMARIKCALIIHDLYAFDSS